jgi:hypothetical protein
MENDESINFLIGGAEAPYELMPADHVSQQSVQQPANG